ncbi:MAG: hypothetical protein AB1735_04090 [Pseudomonadota bacterium]
MQAQHLGGKSRLRAWVRGGVVAPERAPEPGPGTVGPEAAAPALAQPSAAAAPLAFRVFLTRRLVAGALALILLLAVLFALAIIWPMAQQSARQSFDAAAREVDARLQSDFGATEVGLQILQQAFVADPARLDDPEEFVTRARAALQTMPLATSMVLGNGAGQGWMLLWQNDTRQWLLRLTDRGRWGDEQRFSLYNEHGQVLRTWSERIGYDPRTRP